MHTSSISVRIHGPDFARYWLAFAAKVIARASPEQIGRAVRRWQAENKAGRDCKALLAMPDHTLRDIGLTRHEVLAAYADSRPLRRTGA